MRRPSGRHLVAPGVRSCRRCPPPRGVLPLGLGGQALPAHAAYAAASSNATCTTGWSSLPAREPPPKGARHVAPGTQAHHWRQLPRSTGPGRPEGEAARVRGPRGRRRGRVCRVQRSLGDGDVCRVADEACELRVGDRVAFERERDRRSRRGPGPRPGRSASAPMANVPPGTSTSAVSPVGVVTLVTLPRGTRCGRRTVRHVDTSPRHWHVTLSGRCTGAAMSVVRGKASRPGALDLAGEQSPSSRNRFEEP